MFADERGQLGMLTNLDHGVTRAHAIRGKKSMAMQCDASAPNTSATDIVDTEGIDTEGLREGKDRRCKKSAFTCFQGEKPRCTLHCATY